MKTGYWRMKAKKRQCFDCWGKKRKKKSWILSVATVVSEEAFIKRNPVFYLDMHIIREYEMFTFLKCVCLQVKQTTMDCSYLTVLSKLCSNPTVF